MNSTALKPALIEIYSVLGHKSIMLYYFDLIDYDFLQGTYRKLNLELNNQIIDVSKKAKEIGIKKINLRNLCTIFKVSTKNSKKIPSSLFKATQLYLVANHLYKLNG